MHTTAGMALIVGASSVGLLIVFVLRRRLRPMTVDGLLAVVGLVVGVGGLFLQRHVGAGSWIVAPGLLAIIAPVHLHVVFAGEGPLRT